MVLAGPQQERHEELGLFVLIGSEWERGCFGRRAEGRGQEPGEGRLGDGQFVGRYRQAAFHDMEDALGGAAVALRVVQDALHDAIGVKIGGSELVGMGRKGHDTREAGAVEHKGIRRQTGRAAGSHVFQIGIQKLLDARVGRAQPVAEQLVLLIVVAEQRAGDFEEVGVGRAMAARLPKRYQFQVNVAEEFGWF
jgi:hypothetical protein